MGDNLPQRPSFSWVARIRGTEFSSSDDEEDNKPIKIGVRTSNKFGGPSMRCTKEEIKAAISESKEYWGAKLEEINKPEDAARAFLRTPPISSTTKKPSIALTISTTAKSTPKSIAKHSESKHLIRFGPLSPLAKRFKVTSQRLKAQQFAIFEDEPTVESEPAPVKKYESQKVQGWTPINAPLVLAEDNNGELTTDHVTELPDKEESAPTEEDVDPWYWLGNTDNIVN